MGPGTPRPRHSGHRGPRLVGALVAVAAVLVAACASDGGSERVQLASATLAHPLVARWLDAAPAELAVPGLDAVPLSSAGARRHLRLGLLDGALVEEPLLAPMGRAVSSQVADAAARGGGAAPIPLALGAVAFAVSPDVAPPERPVALDSDAITALWLGDVTRWRMLDTTLADEPVSLIHRADAAAATAIATGWLARTNTLWAEDVGHGPSVRWPRGVGAKRSAGVAALAQELPGALTYLDPAHARLAGLTPVGLRGHDGRTRWPTPEAQRVAAVEGPDAAGAWPLTTRLGLLLRAPRPGDSAADGARRRVLAAWARWVLGPGQALCAAAGWAPLPERARLAALEALARVDGASPADG